MSNSITNDNNKILVIAPHPEKTDGIAFYNRNLIDKIDEKFGESFAMEFCFLEKNHDSKSCQDHKIKYTLTSTDLNSYNDLANKINNDASIKMVFIQHEFALFGGEYGKYLLLLLHFIEKPILITFHTVITKPNRKRKRVIKAIAAACDTIIVMTNRSSSILQKEYKIPRHKVSVIPYGTPIVKCCNKDQLKELYQLQDKQILSTFGLLNSNKSIETALYALEKVVKAFPNVLYLIIGKTHPEVIQYEKEIYRHSLREKIKKLGLQNNILFIDKYLNNVELQEYLLLTDIYLHTSINSQQSVSGSLAYAIGSGCPVISTPTPYAKEVLTNNIGVVANFQDHNHFSNAIIQLLKNNTLREKMGNNAFRQTRPNTWENTVIAYEKLFNKHLKNTSPFNYKIPQISLKYLYSLTNNVGIIQYANVCIPNIESGHTLVDNAQALIAICMHYEITKEITDINLIDTYLNFISSCQQPCGHFQYYINKSEKFDFQKDNIEKIEEATGIAVLALGTLISYKDILSAHLIEKAERLLNNSTPIISQINSVTAISFIIKGLYFYYKKNKEEKIKALIVSLTDSLLFRFNISKTASIKKIEKHSSYKDFGLAEVILYAYLVTENLYYKKVAFKIFDFFISKLFNKNTLLLCKGVKCKDESSKNINEEKPSDITAIIQTLASFWQVFKYKSYEKKITIAFSWFLGNNQLDEIIYNPITKGCADDIGKYGVNLNQGANSTVSYLTARLIIEHIQKNAKHKKSNTTNKKKKNVSISNFSLPNKYEKTTNLVV